MTGKIILVTPPDDTLLDGFRIISVGLDSHQSAILSKSLLESNHENNVIVYVFEANNSLSWLFEKKIKSDVIIFNADNINSNISDMIIGYLAAQSNSYYFGILRDLQHVNDRVIYSNEDLGSLIEGKIRKKYER